MTSLPLLLLVLLLAVVDAADWWQPKPGLSWQWQIQGDVDTSVEAHVFDIDLFDVESAVIETLHDKGIAVICYVSAQYENWRPDKDDWPSEALGRSLDDWPGEKWTDFRDEKVQEILRERAVLAKTKLCDGVEWDNVDVHQQKTGFDFEITDTDKLLKFLSDTTHEQGMAVGLKNNPENLARFEPLFDFAVNEQCFQYNECDDYKTTFIANNKAVFNCEYNKLKCEKAAELGLDSIKKSMALKASPLERCGTYDFTKKAYPYPVGTTSAAVEGVGDACSGDVAGSCIDIGQQQCEFETLTGVCPGPAAVQCCPSALIGVGEKCKDVEGVCVDSRKPESCEFTPLIKMCPGSLDVVCCPETDPTFNNESSSQASANICNMMNNLVLYLLIVSVNSML